MADIQIRVEENGSSLTLMPPNRGALRYHAFWLRDNGFDAETRSPGNGQKLISTEDIDKDIRISDATISNGDLKLNFAPSGKQTHLPVDWLIDNAYDTAQDASPITGADVTTWGAELASDVPTGEFNAVMADDSALCDWLAKMNQFGFAKLTGGPTTSGALMDVVDRFGFVRHTNYGKWFEVRTEVNPVNLAFTGLGLPAHTDNPYRDPVPTLQVLYCLENSADGGESMVSDGFRAAEMLFAEDRAGFDLLANNSARFEFYGGDDVHLSTDQPMITLTPEGALAAVRLNNRSCGAITSVSFDDMPAYYAAYSRFAALVNDPGLQVSFKLDPGDSFMVLNTRVLHARKGYSGIGSRWLQGCYADIDGLRSTLASLQSREGHQ